MNLACYYSNNKKLARVKNPLQIYRKEGYLMSKWDTKFLKKGYTFDDILLIPAESHVLPNEVNMQTKLAKNLTLNIPIVTAAMDTVTEAKLAIALAREGGIGFIHKNMSIKEQADEVASVKRNESGFILNPITLKENSTIKK